MKTCGPLSEPKINGKYYLNHEQECFIRHKSFIYRKARTVSVLTETWLNSNVPDEVIDVPGMTLIRKDRSKVMEFGEDVLLCILTMRFMLNRVWTFQIRPLNVSGLFSDRNGYHERFQD